jgi:hypothetical protein
MTLATPSSVACLSPLRFRIVTMSVVAAFLVASHLVFREAAARSYAQYLFVITLGYGHLLGAALGARRGPRASLLTRAFVTATIGSGFALYVEGVTAWPALGFALLALSVWHFTENDVALARALRTGAALEPLPCHGRAQLVPLSAAAAIVAAALAASPAPGPLGDLFSAATLSPDRLARVPDRSRRELSAPARAARTGLRAVRAAAGLAVGCRTRIARVAVLSSHLLVLGVSPRRANRLPARHRRPAHGGGRGRPGSVPRDHRLEVEAPDPVAERAARQPESTGGAGHVSSGRCERVAQRIQLVRRISARRRRYDGREGLARQPRARALRRIEAMLALRSYARCRRRSAAATHAALLAGSRGAASAIAGTRIANVLGMPPLDPSTRQCLYKPLCAPRSGPRLALRRGVRATGL